WFDVPDVMAAMPDAPKGRKPKKANTSQPSGPATTIAPCYPRLACDPNGSVYLTFRGRPGGNWRVGVGSVWSEFFTRLSGDEWSDAVWIPRSNNLLDTRPAVTADKEKLT